MVAALLPPDQLRVLERAAVPASCAAAVYDPVFRVGWANPVGYAWRGVGLLMTYSSTINTSVPAQGAAAASGPLRSNFAAAATDVNALAALIAAIPVTGVWQYNVGNTASVVQDTYVLVGFAPFSGIITGLKAVVGPAAVGGLVETVSINGTPVTGLNGVSVTSASVQTFSATGANTFVTGATVRLVLTIASGSPVGAWSDVLFTVTGP